MRVGFVEGVLPVMVLFDDFLGDFLLLLELWMDVASAIAI